MRFYLLFAFLLLAITVAASYFTYIVMKGFWRSFALILIILLGFTVSLGAFREYYLDRKRKE